MFDSPFSQDVGFAVVGTEALKTYVLQPQEQQIASVIKNEKRLQEFHMGRAAANKALSKFGLTSAVLKGERREPIWPEGIQGSITHTDTHAMAIASKSHLGMGIDLEAKERAAKDISSYVCTPKEEAWLKTIPAAERPLMTLKIFSLKESVFKALYPITKCIFGFDDLDIHFTDNKFEAALVRGLTEKIIKGTKFPVGVIENNTHILSYMLIRAAK